VSLVISWGADHMIARCAIVIGILLAFRPAAAESLNADAARRFVVGKLFAFNCFDGSRGAGRIYGDGSVVGTIQFQGVGTSRVGIAAIGDAQGQKRGCLRFAQSPPD
jgi:hypothetical protein